METPHRQPVDISCSLIVPLGPNSIRNVLSTLPIYFRSDPRRVHLTTVAAPIIKNASGETGSVGFDYYDYEQLVNDPTWQEPPGEITNTLLPGNKNIIKDRLANIWHQFRSQAALQKAGLFGENLPIYNVVILADLWGRGATICLLPVLYYLQTLINNTPKITFQVLLNYATFPGEPRPGEQAARAYRLLTQIEERISPDDQTGDPLLTLLGLSKDINLDHIKFILVDKIKENGLTVSTRGELDAIIGSYLLTTLNGQVADQITESLTTDLLAGNRAFFSSIGSSSIVFDPDPIIHYCSFRLGETYLSQEYLSTSGIERPLVQEFLNKIAGQIGSDYEWAVRLLKDTPYLVVQDGLGWSLAYKLDDLQFHLPDADEIAACSWVAATKEYARALTDEKLPSVQSSMQKDADGYQLELVGHQARFNADLLRQIELHPNILLNGAQTLEDWRGQLQARTKLLTESAGASQAADGGQDGFLSALAELQSALDAFPQLPRIFSLLPSGKIKKLILKVYAFLRLREPYFALNQALSKTQASLKVLAVQPVLKQVNQHALNMTIALTSEVEAAIAEISQFKEKVIQTRDSLAGEGSKYLPQEGSGEGLENYQLFVQTNGFFESQYAAHQVPLEKMRLILLQEMRLMENWKNKSIADLRAIIGEYGQKVFSPIRDITLKQALVETRILGESTQTISQRISAYGTSCLSLLQPNWDFGETFGSSTRQFALVDQETNPLIQPLFAGQWSNAWSVFFTNDPYTYSFLRVKDQIPLKALYELVNEGKLAWESLSRKDMNKADIFPQMDTLRPAVTVSEPDADTLQKTFQWIFTPKGGTNPVEHKLTIQLSRQRYEDYHNRERLSGNYNQYAEDECPEIQRLTSEFQKLHSNHNWSTYNQAYNILTFVQTCFPYSFDKDTTPLSDWPRYPVETLWEGTGDCEDVAILCTALLSRMGYATVLLEYPGHLAFGVEAADSLKGEYILDPATGKKYYYGEATARGWRLGEIPQEYRKTHPIAITPVFIKVKE